MASAGAVTLIAAAAAAPITGAGAATATAAASLVRLTTANASPHMTQSTGNLYWTTTVADDATSSSTGHVYRMSKNVVPGTPRALYSETSSGLWFGDLTWAKVGASYYGYFVVNDSSGSKIKRIPLGGGQATTLTTSTNQIGSRDLVTDGTALFWADGQGLRRMSVAGGAVTELATGTNLRHIGLDASRVYYSAGSFIRSAPKAGGGTSPLVGITSAVRALFVRPGAPSTIYWGEANGTVRSVSPGGPLVIYQAATGRSISSVSFDGTRVLWSGQNADLSYHVRTWRTGVVSGVARLSYPAQNVQGDATAMFWTGVFGTYRYTH